MKSFYQRKADDHYEKWNEAQDSNNEEDAATHMREYINYKEMLDAKNPSQEAV